MIELLVKIRGLVKIDGVVDVKRRENREDVGLDRATSSSSALTNDDEQEAQDTRSPMPPPLGVERLDDEIAEHVEQDVTGEHRDERPQPEAERADQEADRTRSAAMTNLKTSGRPCGTNSEKKWSPCFQKPTPSTIAKRDQRHDAGEGELAGDRERMSAGDDAERHVADEVREQEEDEGGEDPRQDTSCPRARC